MPQQQMTKYTVDVPDTLWREWKETVPRSLNLNDGLVLELGRATLDQRGDELPDSTRQEIEGMVEEIQSKR